MELQSLGSGLIQYVSNFIWCKVNVYKFNTKRHAFGLKTQNSEILVIGCHGMKTRNYYGVLTDIIEIQYLKGKQFLVFKCIWYDVHSRATRLQIDKYGFVSINRKRKSQYQNEPFILTTQAKQVFYAKDIGDKPCWDIVTMINHKYSN